MEKINGANVKIKNGVPQYGGKNEKQEARAKVVDRLKKVIEIKRKENSFREQERRSKFFDDIDDEDLQTVEVDLAADIQKQFEKATPKERSRIAYRYIMDNLRNVYETIDGRKVPIEKIGADKITHNYFEPKIRSSTELGKLIKTGRFIGEKKAEKRNGEPHKSFESFAYYKVIIEIGKERYSAILNIGIRADEKCTLYDINQFNRV